jgi:hypothetical protein
MIPHLFRTTTSSSFFRPWIGLLVGFLGCTVLFRPWLFSSGQALWGGDFDGHLIYWILEWGYHCIAGSGTWVDFWQANSFYPHASTLAYSDSLISVQALYTPLRMAGLSPLLSMHVVLIACCLLGCILTDWALYKAGFATPERACLVTVAHFGLSVTSFLPGHYQLFAFQFAPAFFVLVYLFWRDWKPVDAITATAIFVFATGFAVYFGPICLVLVLPYSIWHLIKNAHRVGVFATTRRLCVPRLIIPVVAMLAMLYVFQLRPYLNIQSTASLPSKREIISYSAKPDSLFTMISADSTWYPNRVTKAGEWEYAYFPGYILIAALLLAIPLLAWKRGHKMQIRAHPPGWMGYMIFLFVFAWVLSLGPAIETNTGRIYLPYELFREYFPGFSGMRTPGRFGLCFGLALGTFLLLVSRFLTDKLPRTAGCYVGPVLAISVFVESLPKTNSYPFEIRNENALHAVASRITPNQPLLILPLAGQNHMTTLRNIMEQLKGSTLHWAKIPAGYGVRSTAELDRIIHLDRMVLEGAEHWNEMADYGREIGIKHILLFLENYPPAIQDGLRRHFHADVDHPLPGNNDVLWIDLAKP